MHHIKHAYTTKNWILKEVVCDVPFQLYLVLDHPICHENRHKISKLLLLLSYWRCYYCDSEVTTMALHKFDSLSLSVLTTIFHVNLGKPVFIEAKDDGSGGNNWSYNSCKAPVKSSPPTNQHLVFYRPDALPVAQPTMPKH